jgi:hypothetical protein
MEVTLEEIDKKLGEVLRILNESKHKRPFTIMTDEEYYNRYGEHFGPLEDDFEDD